MRPLMGINIDALEAGQETRAWLQALQERFVVVAYSSRTRTWRGRREARAWLKAHGVKGKVTAGEPPSLASPG